MIYMNVAVTPVVKNASHVAYAELQYWSSLSTNVIGRLEEHLRCSSSYPFH